MHRRRILASIVCAAAMITPPIGLAHKGVTNPAVMARMNNMTLLAAELAVVGKMLKGETAFDAQTAHLAVRNIARYGEETTALFEAHETDPKSEAKPEIWRNFGDFENKADALVAQALALDGNLGRLEDLAPAMRSLGQACQACHKLYRE